MALVLSDSPDAGPQRQGRAMTSPAILRLVFRGVAGLSVVAAVSPLGFQQVFTVSGMVSEICVSANMRGWYISRPRGGAVPGTRCPEAREARQTSTSTSAHLSSSVLRFALRFESCFRKQVRNLQREPAALTSVVPEAPPTPSVQCAALAAIV